MILKHKTGVLLHGAIAKDPVFKDVGQKRVMKFDVKAHSVKNDAGSWESTYVQVNVWHVLDQWDGMLQKGDPVTVYARKLDERDYNGRTYYSVDADDIQPGGAVIFRWMQMLADMIPPAEPPALVTTDEPTPFDAPAEPEAVQTALTGAQMYPGEQLSDYAPHSAAPPAVGTPEADALIDDDADDLPF